MTQVNLELPEELQQALQQNQVAAAEFRKLPPSHRKQYVEWIQSAKQGKTRRSRAAKAVERLLSLIADN